MSGLLLGLLLLLLLLLCYQVTKQRYAHTITIYINKNPIRHGLLSYNSAPLSAPSLLLLSYNSAPLNAPSLLLLSYNSAPLNAPSLLLLSYNSAPLNAPSLLLFTQPLTSPITLFVEIASSIQVSHGVSIWLPAAVAFQFTCVQYKQNLPSILGLLNDAHNSRLASNDSARSANNEMSVKHVQRYAESPIKEGTMMEWQQRNSR